jgi:hypothetical protein
MPIEEGGACEYGAECEVGLDCIDARCVVPEGDVEGEEDCGTIDNDASEVEEQWSTASLPTPVGGTILSGHYRLTSVTHYGQNSDGPTGNKTRTSVDIDAENGTMVMAQVDNDSEEFVVSLAFTTDGTTLSSTVDCPADVNLETQSSFSVDGDELKLYGTQDTVSVHIRSP